MHRNLRTQGEGPQSQHDANAEDQNEREKSASARRPPLSARTQRILENGVTPSGENHHLSVCMPINTYFST